MAQATARYSNLSLIFSASPKLMAPNFMCEAWGRGHAMVSSNVLTLPLCANGLLESFANSLRLCPCLREMSLIGQLVVVGMSCNSRG